MPALVPIERVHKAILLVRGQKVILDSELATFYGVETKALNRAVKRNRERFPSDFMFQLSRSEFSSLKYQFGTSKGNHGGRRHVPNVFTEHGAIMLASLLNSPIAVQASIQVVRAFVRLRELLAADRELAKKLQELENILRTHDLAILNLFRTIRRLTDSPKSRKPIIGFHP